MLNNAVEIDNNQHVDLHDHKLNIVHDMVEYQEVGWGDPTDTSPPTY